MSWHVNILVFLKGTHLFKSIAERLGIKDVILGKNIL